MMILQECIEKHGHPLIIIHILIMTQVSWHQFQSDALPMRKWDETQFTTKYPRQDETQVTTKYPIQDETQVTTKYPRQDETHFTTKYPRQDETQFTTKYPRQDETQVTKYWVFGPLTKISHIQDGLLTISQAPIINIKTGIVEGGEIRLPPNNRRLEQIFVFLPLFPFWMDWCF
jgi:hypothetical protein